MKYFTFYRESDKFDDILTDTIIKRYIKLKLSWCQHLMIGFDDLEENHHLTYLALKYSDDMTTLDATDRTPVAGVDYMPKRKLRQ
jgi:hypothetical protein